MPQEWHDEPLPRVHRKPPARLLLVLTGLVCAVLTTGTAASVYVAGDASRRATEKVSGMALLDTDSHRRSASVHALIDTLIAPLGALPPMDSAMLRDAVEFLASRDDPDPWISANNRRAATLDTLEFFRAWAKHEPLPAFWGYRTKAWGDGLDRRAGRKLGTIKRFVQLNEAVADSALLAGDAVTAMNRAREIIAASRHLIDQPVGIDMVFGVYVLDRGAMLLARSAQEAGEPVVASAARQLFRMAGANYRLTNRERRALLNMGENPADGRLLALASDRELPPAVRFEAPLESMVKSACINPREMMFGLSGARRDAFDEILSALNDIPRMSEVAPSVRARLEIFDAPADYLNGLKGAKMKESLVSLLVPPVLRSRVKYCQLMGT
jgi:hypothetical protein